ncbi:MAG: GNAT family N-acetyltransferase [Spirosomataceae bacterium]
MAPNFILRKWQAGDEASLAALANNHKIWINLKDVFPHPYTLADAHDWVKFAHNQAENYAIEYEGKAVGGIGLLFKDDIYRKNAEIGYWLGEPYWGLGIISETIKQVVNHAFAQYEINRIYAGVFEYNPASMRVLEKAGFEKEAILKKSLVKEGKLYDEHIYVKFRD